jgi:hypothetical protein
MAAAAVPAAASADGVKHTAAGANPASIQAAVDAFRADVGGNNNGGGGGPQPSGRREINWDGVPDSASDPNPFPGGFFNARGIQFATPGTGFSVSANAVNPTNTPARFGNLAEFQTFSPQRLFRPVGSNVVDNLFFLPGTATQATTNAMGVVFTDVDQDGSAKLEYFDPNGKLLDTVVAPAAASGLSFAGETFTGGERVARVRITSGSGATTDSAGQDAVVMDDFLYGEPQVVAPAAATPPAPPANQPPAKDVKAPKIALLRLLGGGIRYVIASDEPGTYKIRIVVTSAQAKKLKLKKRTVLVIGTHTLQGGGNTVSIKLSKSLKAKLHKAKIKPLLTLDATDLAGNRATQTQRVAV